MLDEVKGFFFAHLDDLALKRVYNKEGTEGIADAKETLLNAFKHLDEEFQEPINRRDRLNQAR